MTDILQNAFYGCGIIAFVQFNVLTYIFVRNYYKNKNDDDCGCN